jgi:hypothetical protein
MRVQATSTGLREQLSSLAGRSTSPLANPSARHLCTHTSTLPGNRARAPYPTAVGQ